MGTILYELAAGRRPLSGATSIDLGSAILHVTPERLIRLRGDLPAALEAVVARCLEKDPRARFQSAHEIGSDLRRLKVLADVHAAGPVGTGPIRALAVLPFENVSHDPAQEYFADGMTEALISELARLKALRVISRTSAMKYKGGHRALPEIARELSVDAILEGSALLVGKRARVTVQLVAARR